MIQDWSDISVSGVTVTSDTSTGFQIMTNSDLGDMAYENLVETEKLGETVVDEGGYIQTSLMELSDGRTFSVLGSGKLYINTASDGHGAVIGDWDEGEGWQINNKGIFNYSQEIAFTAFSSYISDVPWQRDTKTFPAGTISPIDTSFTLGVGDAVFGPYNYKWEDGTECGGLFIDTFNHSVEGNQTAIYLKGDFHIDGNITVTGESTLAVGENETIAAANLTKASAMSQAVHMTGVDSGSNGIQVAHNDSIDFGTRSFTVVWQGRL